MKIKKSSNKMLPLVGIEPLAQNMLLSTLIWHLLLRRSLNFCSCTTWFLDFDDSVRINRAWLYKDPKVSVLQANVKSLGNQRVVFYPCHIVRICGDFSLLLQSHRLLSCIEKWQYLPNSSHLNTNLPKVIRRLEVKNNLKWNVFFIRKDTK